MPARPFPAYAGDDPYVFVSYSHADAAPVFAELERLRQAGINVWYDDGIAPGSAWRDEVALALSSCAVLVYFITPRAVASPNCQQELNFALTRSKAVLCVYLEPAELNPGLELSLSDRQAIVRYQLGESVYADRLLAALRDALGASPPVEVRSDRTDHEARGQSVAVLPLTNRNLEDDLEYLTEGIAEELIRGLAQIPGLHVASQMSTFRLREASLADVGRELGVANVLGGSIQRAGPRLRVNVLLSRVAGGRTLWSQRYDGTIEDVFDLQDDVAARVVEALTPELAGRGEAPAIDVGTRSHLAYQAYLLGRHAMQGSTMDGVKRAYEHFRQAIVHDPDFVEGFTGAVEAAFMRRGFFHEDLEQVAEQIRPLLSDMRRLDPKRRVFRWDDVDATLQGQPPRPRFFDPIADATRAIEVLRLKNRTSRHPEPAAAYQDLAGAAQSLGLFPAAVAYANHFTSHQVVCGDAAQMIGHEIAAYSLAALGRWQEAIEQLDASLAENDDRVNARVLRSCLYSRTGQYSRARDELEILRRSVPKNHAVFCDLYWRGETRAAITYFDDLAARRRYPLWLKIWGNLMLTDGRLGDSSRAEERLSRAFAQLREGTHHKIAMMTNMWSTLRFYCPEDTADRVIAHPEFKAWREAAGLHDAARQGFIDMLRSADDVIAVQADLAETVASFALRKKT